MSKFTMKDVEPLTAELFILIQEAAAKLGSDEAIRQAGFAFGMIVVALGAPGGVRRMQDLIAVHAQAANAGIKATNRSLAEAVIAANGGRQ